MPSANVAHLSFSFSIRVSSSFFSLIGRLSSIACIYAAISSLWISVVSYVVG